MVPRQRLLRRLQEHPGRTLVLSAPSGYGKSVLLGQLAEADPRPSFRILLSTRHNDPTVLVEETMLALGERVPFPAGLSDALAAPNPNLDGAVIPRLHAALATRAEPFLLVLDELEALEAPAALKIVAALCGEMPPGSQLAIASRTEQRLSLGRLRANRRLTELRREDLTMTKGECAALLAGLGLELSAAQLDAMVRRTEGWPAVLYLAGLAVGEASDPGRAVSRFAGDDRIVVDYLREELLLPVSEPRLDFLRRASVLEKLSGPLCDAVLERSDSGAELRELARANTLLIPLDRRDEWFRLHPLLREMLRAELHGSEAAMERELSLRASRWWAEQGDLDLAIHHAVEAGVAGRAGELLWTAVPEYMTRGRNATMVAWLKRLGEPRVAASPGLSLTAAWAELTLGRGPKAEHRAAVTQRLLAAEDPSELKDSMDAGLALVAAVLCRDGLTSMRASIAAVEPLLPDESPWLTLCCLLDGVGLHLLGDADTARRRLAEGVRRGSVGAPNLQVICLSQLALLALGDGDLQRAEAEVAHARAQIDRSGLGNYPMIALAFATSAVVRARRGSVDRARADFATATALLGHLDHYATWYEIEVRLLLADAAVRLGDRGAAERLLDEASRQLVEMGEESALDRWLVDGEEALARTAAADGEMLTPAELRILQFLPTHLSFPQMAARVHVSPNTVKTHVRNIYRKFGVSSRQSALEHAERAGLLGRNGAGD